MIDIQQYIDTVTELEKVKREQRNYNLGNLIDDLSKYPESANVEIAPFCLYPTGLTSYRGYYSDLAIMYGDSSHALTCGQLLKECKKAVGRKFYGYKGGEFEMSKNTVLWIAPYGRTTDVVVTGVKDCFGDGSYLELTWKIEEGRDNA